VTAPALELRGIEKRFGPVHALHGADFTLMPGELHALLGENGAGKSTLMHVAYGLVRPDAGEVRVRGMPAAIRSPRDARRHGIGMVHQHFTSVPALSVAENIALAAGWPIHPRELRTRVEALMQRVGLPLDADAEAGTLSAALKQRLEILKALAADTSILLLDEPTGVLTPPEIDELLRVVRSFTAAGGSVVLITHKLDEALQAASRVTVLRAGRVSFTGPATGQTARSLAAAMLGTEAALPVRPPPAPAELGPALVRATGLTVARERGGAVAVREADLAVHGGEIVGIMAVEGNGQRELLRAIAGLLPVMSGHLEVTQPAAFIPEDRTTEALIPELTLTENVVLGLGRRAPWVRGIRVDWPAARRRTAELIDEFSIRAPGPEIPARSLSGGNQQRLVIARALEQRPQVIIAENPTRGLDIHATAVVWGRLREAAAAGAAVLVYSSDLDEVLEQTNRHWVMANGHLLSVLPGSSREAIGALLLRGRGQIAGEEAGQ
jgi:simple sugar transport system ATP-binding protein